MVCAPCRVKRAGDSTSDGLRRTVLCVEVYTWHRNLAIDDQLLNEALRVGGQRTKKETVTQALQEYVQRRKQAQILDLFGRVDLDPKYHYKRQRRRS